LGWQEVEVPLARRLLLFFGVSVVSVVFDQVTKVIATDALKNQPAITWLNDTFRLSYATNEGAFLSLGASLPPTARYWVLTIGVGLLLLGISIYALKTPLDAAHTAGYALIVSGGFSNWFDRARFGGAVVDFMNMGIGSLRTGVFNVADLAILGGIGVLLIAGRKLEKAKKAKAAAAPTPQSNG
jgi:signal peptidase II